MKRLQFLLVVIVAMLLGNTPTLKAQSGLYIPSAKPVRNMKKALVNPESFCLLIQYKGDDKEFGLGDLDLMDSAYAIAFNHKNPKLYTMMVEGYGDANQELTNGRVNEVIRYFSKRCHSTFPVRFAENPIHCSCHGDTVEQLRFEVPLSIKIYDCATLPESRMMLNGNINLHNSVLVTFHHNPEECIGLANGCYLPSQDTTIRGYYTTLTMPRGAVYAVSGTKDSCPPPLDITIEEHLDYASIVERYYLVPHPKQIIAQVGYVVLKSNFNRAPGECEQELNDSIFLRMPITQEQWANKLRVYGKSYGEKGVEYKMLNCRKVTNRATNSLYLQVALNPTMFDTLYFGKRVKADDIKDYFYPVDTDREEGVITVKGKYYKAFRLNRRGEYESRKMLKILFRQDIEQEEDEHENENKGNTDDEELPDD